RGHSPPVPAMHRWGNGCGREAAGWLWRGSWLALLPVGTLNVDAGLAPHVASPGRHRAGQAPHLPDQSRYSTLTISYSRWPAGASMATLSPSSLPISARATGEEMAIRPSLMSASRSP